MPVGLPQIEFAQPFVMASPLGFLTITPFTEQRFLLPAELIAAVRGNAIGFRITLHYTAWTGDVRIFQDTVHYPADNEAAKLIEHVKSELSSGSLNEVRRKFGMTEVPTPESVPRQ